jgi:hypothetical protein
MQVPCPAAVTNRKPASISMIVWRTEPPPKWPLAPRASDWNPAASAARWSASACASPREAPSAILNVRYPVHEVIEQPVQPARRANTTRALASAGHLTARQLTTTRQLTTRQLTAALVGATLERAALHRAGALHGSRVEWLRPVGLLAVCLH